MRNMSIHFVRSAVSIDATLKCVHICTFTCGEHRVSTTYQCGENARNMSALANTLHTHHIQHVFGRVIPLAPLAESDATERQTCGLGPASVCPSLAPSQMQSSPVSSLKRNTAAVAKILHLYQTARQQAYVLCVSTCIHLSWLVRFNALALSIAYRSRKLSSSIDDTLLLCTK